VTAADLLKVLTKPETQKLVGLSDKTWDRLEGRGDVPIKTRLSQNRIGYRVDHIKQWLDARREASPSDRTSYRRVRQEIDTTTSVEELDRYVAGLKESDFSERDWQRIVERATDKRREFAA
jgi:predicted DNA-binding transcriptional regulator AlpA